MEIERKFLLKELPSDLEKYPVRHLEQGYLCTGPVVRIRKDNDKYELTYKAKGMMVREEYNLPLTKEAYEHLKGKIDGRLITKKRYMIPFEKYTIELDVFEEPYKNLIIAEVEFESEEQANNYIPPEWFGRDVSLSGEYQNNVLSRKEFSNDFKN